jgi:hypothetical protein
MVAGGQCSMGLTEVSTDLDDIADLTSRMANTAGERVFLNLLPLFCEVAADRVCLFIG